MGLSTEALHEQIRRRRWGVDDPPADSAEPSTACVPPLPSTENPRPEPAQTGASTTREIIQGVACLGAVSAACAFLVAKLTNTPASSTGTLPSALAGTGLAAWLIGYAGYRTFRRSWTGCWVFVALLFTANAVVEHDKRRPTGTGASTIRFSTADRLRLRESLVSSRETLRQAEAVAGGQNQVVVAISEPMIILLSQSVDFLDAEVRWEMSAAVHESTGSVPSRGDLLQARTHLDEMERLSGLVLQGTKNLVPTLRKRLTAAGMNPREVEREVQSISGDLDVDSMTKQHTRIGRKISLERLALDMKIAGYGSWRLQGGRVTFDTADANGRYASTASELASVNAAIEQWNQSQIAPASKQ